MDQSTKLTRLHKFIAQSGLASRRHAEQLITDGRVSVNGEVVTEQGRKIDPEVDIVLVDGERASPEPLRLYRFHKPAGVITTLDDQRGRKSVADFVSDLPVRVFPVGRLDADVVGLLLLTNDGDLAEKLLHPRYGVERTYYAYLEGRGGPEFCQQLVSGVKSTDDPPSTPLKAKRARLLENASRLKWLLGELPKGCFGVEIVVAEGRKHFVKKLCAGAGCPVVRLGRVGFGQFTLDELPRGTVEELPFSADFIKS
ncbi:MAG: rRNA pseudouridine synthase [Bdellovibrionales bacterium]|nr:rRNA pseudouridine synthase [Bdellovibrionales bacterium]